ncbi:MAG: PaaI family thioesterase [Gallionella sp.]
MDLLTQAQMTLASQPFSKLVGANLTAFANGQSEITIPIADRLKQQHGFVHGGVLSYAADNAITFAGGSVLGPAVVTSELKINYLRPCTGWSLIARAHVVHVGKSQAVAQCDVFSVSDKGEALCAVAQGTIAKLR